MSRAWLRRTPSSFLFAVKLYQKFTHPDMYLGARRRAGLGPVARRFRSVPRGHRAAWPRPAGLAAVLAQFPPSFQRHGPTRARLSRLAARRPRRLSAGGGAAPSSRGATSEPATRQLLSQHRAAWVLIDEPKFESSIRQPLDLVPIAEAPIAYLRLHGRNAAAWWDHAEAEDRYNYPYSAEELSPFAEAARDAAQTIAGADLFQQSLLGQSRGERRGAETRPRPDHSGGLRDEMVERYPELKGVVQTQHGFCRFPTSALHFNVVFLIMSLTAILSTTAMPATTWPMTACLPSRLGLGGFHDVELAVGARRVA